MTTNSPVFDLDFSRRDVPAGFFPGAHRPAYFTKGQTMNNATQTWNGRGRLENLVGELNRQRDSRIDFVADCRSLAAVCTEAGTEDGSIPRLKLCPSLGTNEDGKASGLQVREFIDADGVELNDNAFAQLCQKSEPAIPVLYGRKLLSVDPIALGNLVDDTFCGTPNRRLFRVLDGRVRAVLSDQYRILDHYDVAFQALETVRNNGGEVIECTLDDNRMRIKFTTRAVFDVLNATNDAGGGHKFYGSDDWLAKSGFTWSKDRLPGGPGTIHPTVTVGNSETGKGGFYVALGIMHAVCVNTAKIEEAVDIRHLGGKMDEGLFTQETIAADSRAIFLKARDAIANAFRPEHFQRLVGKIRPSANREIKAPTAAANLVAERLGLDDQKRDDILAHFIRDYQPNALGLANAITRASQDVDDPEVADEWEAFAGEMMASPAKVLSGVE